MHETARNKSSRLRFGPFEVDRLEGKLYKRGIPLRIENQPLQVLIALLERPDEIVTREELQQRIWGDGTNVEFSGGLNATIRKLRLALGDSADSPMFIETIPKRGYRLINPFTVNGGLPASPVGSVQAGPEELHLVEDTTQDPRLTPAGKFPKIASPNRRQFVAPVVVLVFVVTIAIAGLLFWRHRRFQRLASSFPPIQARRLEGAHAWQAVALSPDGRYVAYTRTDGKMTSIRLRQVANAGEEEILPPRKKLYASLTFSPDGDDLYYVCADEDHANDWGLYRMPTLGGPTQKLIENVDSSISFSPDGRRFIFARLKPPSTLELRTADADGSGEQLFAQFPEYDWGCDYPYPTWSPDGRTIAVVFRGTASPGRNSIYTVDVATGSVEQVFSGSGCIRGLTWMPNKALIFNRDGGLWTVLRKDDVARAGHIEGYSGDLDRQIGLSRDGKTAVTIGYLSGGTDLWVRPVEPPGSAAKQLIFGDVSLGSVEELINGRLLITKQDNSLWTAKADGSDWQRLTNVLGFAIGCGQFVVVQLNSDRSLLRLNADGTGSRTIVHDPTASPTCSLKGDAVFFVTLGQPDKVMRVPIDGGNPVIVAKIPIGVPVTSSISPDGGSLAYSFFEVDKPITGFAVLRTSDGGLVKLIEGPSSGFGGFRWSPDGKAFDYVSSEDSWTEVWEQPLAGGVPKRITRFGSGSINDLHWSRDGKRLLVVRGPVGVDVVLLRGLQ